MSTDRNSKQMGRLLALSQIGFEMVAPIVLGVVLDNKLGWTPWGVTCGAVLGLVGGFAHLLLLLHRFEEKDPPSGQDET
jgi:F0F1-type ATP synthase assembly protein I